MPDDVAVDVYVKLPLEFSVSVPFDGNAATCAVSGVPSGSESFTRTPGAVTVSGVSYRVVYASFAAVGARFVADFTLTEIVCERVVVPTACTSIVCTPAMVCTIIDSRNAGNRYDLVIAGMAIIGLIGLMLDGLMRLLESLKWVKWRYAHQD